MTLQALTLAILVLPAAGSVGLGLGALRVPRRLVQVVGPGTVWVAFLCSLVLFVDQLTNGGRSHDFTYWTWLSSGDLQVPVDLFVDRLSVFMCLIVTGVGGLIVTYSNGYMEHETDGSYARFFCYMDLFITSMLLLVLAGNLVLLIVGWAGVGLSSYLLIGFFYWRWSAVVAARKAFVMNVIGDVGMILGTFVLFAAYHSVTYAGIFAALPKTDSPLLELAAFLLLVGAVAKSAQLPLHTWLPDAMEGPTPVSALIHAATMVTAGVYLVGRLHPLYDLAWIAHGAVALIGTMTALFAASIAIVQTDIKRVLAYSTMSLIGYMFLAVGVGAYAAGFFHLMAHAFFKALLFLGAGNVIHSMNDEQDMRRYGGLWGQMRGTSICFLIGSLSLAGIIPFVGFWSKEVVLGDVFSKPDAGGFPQAMGHRLRHRHPHRLLHRAHVVDGLQRRPVAGAAGGAAARGPGGDDGPRGRPRRPEHGGRLRADQRRLPSGMEADRGLAGADLRPPALAGPGPGVHPHRRHPPAGGAGLLAARRRLLSPPDLVGLVGAPALPPAPAGAQVLRGRALRSPLRAPDGRRRRGRRPAPGGTGDRRRPRRRGGDGAGRGGDPLPGRERPLPHLRAGHAGRGPGGAGDRVRGEGVGRC